MNSNLGLGTLQSTAGYIGIRAQLSNPINRKLPRTKKAGRRRIRSRDLGSLRLHFLLFYFLLFSFFFLDFVVFRVDYFFYYSSNFRYFLDLGVIVLSGS